MKRYKLFGEPNTKVNKSGTTDVAFSFDANGECYLFEGTFDKRKLPIMKSRFNAIEEEIMVLTKEEYESLVDFKDKYNKKKMEVVSLKGQLNKVKTNED